MIVARAMQVLAHGGENARDLAEQDAFDLCSAVLDGGIAELELGAALAALDMKRLAPSEISGFRRALQPRLNRLDSPERLRAVVIPSYGGARAHANLMPLLALMLARFGVPVLIHGALEAQGRVASAAVLRELGVLPCKSLAEAQSVLESTRLAFVPTGLLSPALAQLLALRARLGTAACARQIARLADPFDGRGLQLVPADDENEKAVLTAVLGVHEEHALLFVGSEGEAYVDPLQRPAIVHFRSGEPSLLFHAEAPHGSGPAGPAPDAKSTALWIQSALDGKTPLPSPMSRLLASCLYGSGLCDGLHQAMALVALRTCNQAAA
ncbi:MAG TPA: DNA-binding protein YbiB [Burkholderiales bacterium]|nr:DNA-binding protein YbiB [Burkholderiales bacterium]